MPNLKTAPKISVIVAVKDSNGLLRGALESLAAQVSPPVFETIVIDGGSHDDDIQIAKQFGEKGFLTKIEKEKKSGLYAAWNQAIELSQGDYLLNLNSDDRLAPHALLELSQGIEQYSADLVYGDSWVTESLPGNFNIPNEGRRLNWPDFSRAELLIRCICGPHPMWRKHLHRAIGFFDESFSIAGDYEFWLRVAEHFSIKRIYSVVGLYYANPCGLSLGNRRQLTEENNRIKRMYMNSGHFDRFEKAAEVHRKDRTARGNVRLPGSPFYESTPDLSQTFELP